MPSVPLTKYGGGWGYAPTWLKSKNYKVKGAVTSAVALGWIEVCDEYIQHDPEGDLARPLCFAVHDESVCRRLEGHG